MCITVCHLRSSGFLGGPEKQLLGFARELQCRGIQPFIAAWSLPSGVPDLLLKAASCGIPCAPLPLRTPGDPRTFADVAKLLRRVQPNLLAAHDYKAVITGLPTARLLRIPLVVHARGRTSHTRRVQIYEALERTLMRYADHVVTVSEAMRRELISTGIDPNRVTAVHNSINPPAAPPNSLLKTTARRRLGLPENALVVGSVGRLSPEKGHAYLLEAAAKLNGSAPGFVLVLIGDGPEKENLSNLCSSLKISDRVRLVGFASDAGELIAAFDILALPSLSEGLPNVVLEAYAKAVPVVASAVGGVPEVVRHGETGLLVAPKDSDALASAIAKLLASPSEAQRMGRAGFELVTNRFCTAKNADKLARVYASVAKKGGFER